MTEKTYTTLEDLDRREFALTDPRGFLGQYPDGAILDEIHHAPLLLSYLQTLVEATAGKGYSFLPDPNSSVCAITSLKPSPDVSVFSNSCRYQ